MVKKYKRSGSETAAVYFTHEEEVNGELVENEFEADCGVTFGSPGKLYGPPEDCYPPEGDEVDVGEIWQLDFVKGKSNDKKGRYVRVRRREDLEKLLDTDKRFRESIEESAVKSADESSKGRYDSYIDDCVDSARDREFDDAR